MPNAPHPEAPLRNLADGIRRAGMATPIRIALDVCAPLDVISSQLALFVRPFTDGSRWQSYAQALSNEQGWQQLRSLLAADEC